MYIIKIKLLKIYIMERDVECNLEDIYTNMDGQVNTPHNKHLLNDASSNSNFISFYCRNIYNYLVSCFFPSHINSLYE